MRAEENAIEPPTGLAHRLGHFVVNGMQRIDIEQTPLNPRLIGGDRDRPASMGEPRDRLKAARYWLPFIGALNVGITIEINHTVPIQNNEWRRGGVWLHGRDVYAASRERSAT